MTREKALNKIAAMTRGLCWRPYKVGLVKESGFFIESDSIDLLKEYKEHFGGETYYGPNSMRYGTVYMHTGPCKWEILGDKCLTFSIELKEYLIKHNNFYKLKFCQDWIDAHMAEKRAQRRRQRRV
jgi:hypothetical protein